MTTPGTTWLEVQIEVPEGAAEVIASAAGEVAAGVEIRDGGTVIRATPGRALIIVHVGPEDRLALAGAIAAAADLARAAGVHVDPVVLREREAHEDEWRDVWKQFFRATRVGRTVLIRPTWDLVAAADGDRVIDIDPGRAFGTGAHPSTRLMIVLAEELADARRLDVKRFLDLGCGSGILSIAAARFWRAAAGVAIDIDPESTACAAENFERNGVRSVVLATGTLGEPSDRIRGGSFDLVLANIQADVLASLAGAIVERTAPGGVVLLSGLLLDHAAPTAEVFTRAGLELHRRVDEGEWSALELTRPARS